MTTCSVTWSDPSYSGEQRDFTLSHLGEAAGTIHLLRERPWERFSPSFPGRFGYKMKMGISWVNKTHKNLTNSHFICNFKRLPAILLRLKSKFIYKN